MAQYVLIRLGHALIILAIVTVLVFIMARLLPGDAIMAQMSGTVGVQDPAVVARVRQEFGLDQPLYQQFLVWLGKFLRGDWGVSLGTGQPVLEMFLQRLPITLELFAWATVWSFVIGIPVGIVSAVKRGSLLDMALTTGALFGVSIPPFWLGIVLIYVFAVALPIFPPSGYVPPSESLWLNFKAMVLPSLVLGTNSAGLLARYVRSSLLEVLSQDYIRTARAKGLTERAVVRLHAIKPAMIPVVTVVGLSWGGMLAGAFFAEVIFAIPGLGRMSVDAIFQKDFPVMQAMLIAVAVNVLVVNLLVDLLYGYLDPRVRVRS
jgi:peptide/nickel transport system permease protein